jgi:RimJ/RimL family protein N-acetyltransferase
MINFKKICHDDLEFLNRVRNEYCEEFLHDSEKFTIDDTVQWFNLNNPNYYIIFLNETRIGYFRLSNYSKKNKNIYVGADISPEFKGLGYGKLSYKKFLPFLFNEYDLNKVSLEVLSTNSIAINLYTNLGFVTEGIKRDEIYKNGKWINSIIMSMLKKELEINEKFKI